MISEQLRATLLSLKQISDRLKLLNTTSVTKSEALAYKNEIIEALEDIDFTEITEALNSINGKIDDISTELEDVAQETTLTEGIQSVLQGLAPKATTAQLNTATETILTAISHIDIDTTTLAKEQTLTNALQSVLTALNPKATTNDVTTAKDAILEALSHISPEDPYSQALAAFFNITPPVPNAVPMTQQEVEDDLDELWNLIITQ